MDGEGRQKKVEAGREKLSAYLKKRHGSTEQKKKKKKSKGGGGDAGEAGSSSNSMDSASTIDFEGTSVEMETQKTDDIVVAIPKHETPSKRDSMATGDFDEVEKLRCRVIELEDLLSAKVITIEAMQLELETLHENESSGSLNLSQGTETEYKSRLEEYHKKIIEYQEAIHQRDCLIEQVTASLQQTLKDRDAYQQQAEQWTSEVAVLERQLKATKDLVQSHQWDTGVNPQDYLNLRNEMLALDITLKDHQSLVERLKSQLSEQEESSRLRDEELEKKSLELKQVKLRSSEEVQKLMKNVEELHQRAAAAESNNIHIKTQHEGDLRKLRAELEENFGLQLVQIKKEYRYQADLEKEEINQQHREAMVSSQKSYEDAIAQYKVKMNAMIDLQEQFESSGAKHKSEVSDLHEEVKHLTKININLSSEIHSLSDALKTKESEMEKCRNDLQEVSVQFLKYQSLFAGKEEVEQQLQKQIRELRAELDSSKSSESVIGELQSSNAELKSQLLRAKEELEQAKLQSNDASAKYAELKSHCDLLETEKKEFVSEKKDMDVEIEHLYSQVQSLKQELTNNKVSATKDRPSSSSSTDDSCRSSKRADAHKQPESTPKYDETSSSVNVDDVSIDFEDEIDVIERGLYSLKRRRIDYRASPSSGVAGIFTLMERCEIIEREKSDLESEVGVLSAKLQEHEVSTVTLHDEKLKTEQICKSLQKKCHELSESLQKSSELEKQNIDLRVELNNLNKENDMLLLAVEDLKAELTNERMKAQEQQETLQKQLCSTLDIKTDNLEELILDLCTKAKELIVAKEQIKSLEHSNQNLERKLQHSKELCDNFENRYSCSQEELVRIREQLEELWRQNEESTEELAKAKRDLALSKLHEDQLEKRLSLSNISLNESTIVPQEVQEVVDNMVQEVSLLKKALEQEKNRSEKFMIELQERERGVQHEHMLQFQQKLEVILKSNSELVAEKEALVQKIREQQEIIEEIMVHGSSPESESLLSRLGQNQDQLMMELSAFREQHTSISELLGTTAVLQETLRVQKDQLLQKLKEKSEVENVLEEERAKLKQTYLRLQLMESQIIEKDRISQELSRQKRMLEMNLQEIEDRLRDKEDLLLQQKLNLEAEIRNRELEVQRWKVDFHKKEVEYLSQQTTWQLHQQESNMTTVESGESSTKEQLDSLKVQFDEAHNKAVARLKLHLQEQFSLRELQTEEKFAKEISTLKQQHSEQLQEIQNQLQTKVKDLEALVESEMLQHIGITKSLAERLQLEDVIEFKESHKQELEEIRKNLDDKHAEIYVLLREKFEQYAQKQIAFAVQKLKEEYNLSLRQEISNQKSKHEAAIEALKARVEHEKKQEVLCLREELGKQHKEMLNSQMLLMEAEIEELKEKCKEQVSKVSTKRTCNSEAALEELKNHLYAEFTAAVKDLKIEWEDKCHDEVRLVDEELENEWKREAETRLAVEHGADVAAVTECQETISRLLHTRETMLEKMQETLVVLGKKHVIGLQTLKDTMDQRHKQVFNVITNLQETANQCASLMSWQDMIEKLTRENAELQTKYRTELASLKNRHEEEITKLNNELSNVKVHGIQEEDITKKLEARHAKEMESLRIYFERKCAEVEKRYTEDVFNRKMSTSSTGSETDLIPSFCYAGGDHGPRISSITHICDSYAVEPSYKDLEEHYRLDFEKRCTEYHDQLQSAKKELEVKYKGEMDNLKSEYEMKVETLLEEIKKKHGDEVQELKEKHAKEVENMKLKYETDLAAEVNSAKKDVSATVESEVEHVKAALNAEHEKKLVELQESYEQKLSSKIARLTSVMEKQESDHIEAVKAELNEKHRKELKILEESLAEKLVEEVSKSAADSAIHKVEMEQRLREEIKAQYEEENEKKLAQLMEQLETKHKEGVMAEIEAERKLLNQQFEELTNAIKTNSEREQDKFMERHKEMMDDFLKHQQKDLQSLKQQHEDTLKAVEQDLQKKYNYDLQQISEIHAAELSTSNKFHTEKLQASKEEFEKNKAALQRNHENEITKLNEEWQEKLDKLSAGNNETVGKLQKSIEDLKKKHAEEMMLEQQRIRDELINDHVERFQAISEQLDAVHKIEMEELETKVTKAYADIMEQLQQEIKHKENNSGKVISEMKILHEKEIEDIKATYERRLIDEVESTKFDILKALEEQIQALLNDDAESEARPIEFVALQEKFAAKYREEMSEMEKNHREQLNVLKQAYKEDLNQTIEECNEELKKLEGKISDEEKQRQIEYTRKSLQAKLAEASRKLSKEYISISQEEFDKLNKERENWKKACHSVKDITNNLLTFFNKCEEELNMALTEKPAEEELELEKPEDINTTLRSDKSGEEGELAYDQHNVSNEVSASDMDSVEQGPLSSDDSISSHSTSHAATPKRRKKRVTFAPDVENVLSLFNDEDLLRCVQEKANPFAFFASDLDKCLSNLRLDIRKMMLSLRRKYGNGTSQQIEMSLLEDKISMLTEQLHIETEEKDKLLLELHEARGFTQGYESERQSYVEQIRSMESNQESLIIELQAAKDRLTEVESDKRRREVVTEGYGENIQPNMARRVENLAQLQDKARKVVSDKSPRARDPSRLLNLIEELCKEGDKLTEEARKEKEDLEQQVEAADKQLRATRAFLEEQAAEREQERDEFSREIEKLHDALKEKERERNEWSRVTNDVDAVEYQLKEASTLLRDEQLKREELEAEFKAALDKIYDLREIIRDLENQLEHKTKNETELHQQIKSLQVVVEQQNKTQHELTEELEMIRVGAGQEELTNRIRQLEEQLRKHVAQVELLQANTGAVQEMKKQLRELEATVEKKTKELELLQITVSSATCSSPSEDVSIREQLEVLRSDTPEDMRTHSPIPLPLEEVHRLQDKLQRLARAEEAALKKIRDLEMQVNSAKRNEDELQAERDVLQQRLEEQLLQISSLQSRLDEHRRRMDNTQSEATSELHERLTEMEHELEAAREIIERKDKKVKELSVWLEHTQRLLTAQEREYRERSEDESSQLEKLKEECEKLQEEKNELEGGGGHLFPYAVIVDTLMKEKNDEIDFLYNKVSALEIELGKPPSARTDLSINKQTGSEISTLPEPEIERAVGRDSVSMVHSQGEFMGTFTSVPAVSSRLFKKPGMTSSSEGDEFLSTSDLLETKSLPADVTGVSSGKFKTLGFEAPGVDLQRIAVEHARCDEKLAMLPVLEREVEKLKDQLQTTIKAMLDDNRNYEEQLCQMQNEMSRLNAGKSQSGNEADVMLRLQELEEENRFLREECTCREDGPLEVREVKGDGDDELKREIEKLKRALEEKNKEIEMLKKSEGKGDDLELRKALEAKDEELEQLKKVLEAKNAEIAKLKSTLEEKNDEIDDLRMDLQGKDSEIGRLKSALKNAGVELESERTDKNRLSIVGESAIAKCKEELKGLQSENESLKGQLQNLKVQFDQVTAENGNLKVQLRDLQSQFSQEKQSKENEISQLKNALDGKESEISQLRKALEGKESEISQLRKALEGKESEISQLKKSLEGKDSEINQLKTTLDGKEKDMSQLRSVLEGKDREMNDLRRNLQSKDDEMGKLRSQLMSAGSDLQAERSDKNRLSVVGESAITKCKEELNGMKSENDKLKGQLQNLQAQFNDAKAEGDNLKKQLSQAKTETDNLRMQLNEAKGESENLKTQLNQAKTENENLKKQLQDLQSQLNQENAKLAEQMKQMQSKLDQAQEEINRLKAELALGGPKDVADRDKIIADLKKQLEDERAKVKGMEQQLQDMDKQRQEQLALLSNRIDAMNKQLLASQDLEHVAADLEEKLRTLTRSLESEKEANATLRAEVEKLKKDVQDKSKEISDLQNKLQESEKKLRDMESKMQDLVKAHEKQLAELTEAHTAAMNKSLASMKGDISAQQQAAIAEVEENYRKKLEDQKKQYENMIADLKAQHAKEIEELNRKHNENLAAVKAGYERDMKNMQDMHDKNVLRLQGMHEEETNRRHTQTDMELDDLNKMNELRLKRMMEDNEELVASLRKECDEEKAKLKKQWDQEKAGLKKQCEDEKAAMKKSCEQEKAALKKKYGIKMDSLMQQGMEGLEGLRRVSNLEVQTLNDEYEKAFDEMDKKHRAEIERLNAEVGRLNKRIAYLEGILDENGIPYDGMKGDRPKVKKDKEEVDEIGQKVQEELDLSVQLDKSLLSILQSSEGPCVCGEGITKDALEKVQKEGLEVLSLSELTYMQKCPCRSEPEQDQSEKLTLKRKITALDTECLRREREMQKKVDLLEFKIRQERSVVEELRSALNLEQKRSLELIGRLGEQRKVHVELEVEHDILQQRLGSVQETAVSNKKRSTDLQRILEQQKAQVVILEQALQTERSNFSQLKNAITTEKQRVESTKQCECSKIGPLQYKLEKSLDSETKLKIQLEQEQKVNGTLQANALGKESPFNDYKNLLEEEQKQRRALAVSLEREKRKVQELQQLRDRDRQRAQQELGQEQESNHHLNSQLIMLQNQKDELHRLLVSEHDKCSHLKVDRDELKRKVQSLQEEEVRVNRRREFECQEFNQRRTVLQIELEQSKQKQHALQQELAQMQQQMSLLQHALEDTKGRERQLAQEVLEARDASYRLLQENQVPLSSSVAAPYVQRIKKMNDFLERHIRENSEVSRTLARLVEERQEFQAKINHLEEKIQETEAKWKSPRYSDSIENILASERAAWAEEREALQVAVHRAEAETSRLRAEVHGRGMLSSNASTSSVVDTDDRVLYLFGKYLRAESFRKALIWQKKYLLKVLGGYQETEAVTVRGLAEVSGVRVPSLRHNTHVNPRIRFRSAAVVIIAIHRMKYIVLRWRRGRRIGSCAVLGQGYSESVLSNIHLPVCGNGLHSAAMSPCSFQPVVTDGFYTGSTPPTRDQIIHRRDSDRPPSARRNIFQEEVVSSRTQGSDVLEYITRFEQIKHTLGLPEPSNKS